MTNFKSIGQSSTTMIKAVIFDFGNVICSFDNRIFIRKIAEFSPYTFDELYEMIYRMGSIVEIYELGQISSEEFFERMKELCKLDMDIEDFREAFTTIFTPIPETIELIKKLKGSCKLGLLSNTNEWDHEHAIKIVDVYPLFDAVTTSYEVGVKKPDERMYLDCLEKLDLGPEECIYIDDIKEYADGAAKVGMIGLHYTGRVKLEEDITELI
jgi:putative hydrolase of the HAD superfamily